MGGKGGDGSATNQELVDMQKSDAADAKAKEADRQARLASGTSQIKSIFEGAPVIGTKSTPYDWSQFTANKAPSTSVVDQMYGAPVDPTTQSYGLPAGYKVIKGAAQTPAGSTAAKAPLGDAMTSFDPYTGQPKAATPANSGAAASSMYEVEGPDGKIYQPGDALNYDESYDTGAPHTGGFDDGFYGKYRQSIMDYYLPQEGDQYNTARSSLAASLARAGTSNSTVAAMDIGKLANQDEINRAQIASGADSQTAQLRSTIAQDEKTALDQLYSTEDPSLAANTATNLVANAQLTKPMLNPAGALFAPLTVGVGNAISGFTNPAAYINPSVASTPTPVKDYGLNSQA